MNGPSVEWEVRPYVGSGPLYLGMSQAEVDATIGLPSGVVAKGTEYETVVAYENLGIHVYFEGKAGCAAIEFWGSVMPTLLGQQLLRRPFTVLRTWFKSVDDNVEILVDGLRSIKFGTSIYASLAKGPEHPNDGAMVFRRGYFDCD